MFVIDNLPKAVLFDMDGTLIDSEIYWLVAERELVDEFGGEWTEEHASALVGSSLDRSAAILIDAGVELPPAEVIDRLSHSVKRQVALTLPWRPGARELVTALHAEQVPIALVTMSYSLNANDFAHKAASLLGFEVFSTIVSGDDVRRGKPDPEPYLLAANRLGVDVSQCVAIEDSIPGVTSAVASGAATIAVPLFHDLTHIEGITIWDSLEDKSPADLAPILSARLGRS